MDKMEQELIKALQGTLPFEETLMRQSEKYLEYPKIRSLKNSRT